MNDEYGKGGYVPGPGVEAVPLDVAECLVRADDPTKCIRTQAEHMDYWGGEHAAQYRLTRRTDG